MKFFDQVGSGRFGLIVSALVEDELLKAPKEVHRYYEKMISYAEVVYPTTEAIKLQKAYLDVGILTPRWSDDALHVATATVSKCHIIVSWNFKHIVHFDKIPKYNAVNTLMGYGQLSIYTPSEVISYEEEL